MKQRQKKGWLKYVLMGTCMLFFSSLSAHAQTAATVRIPVQQILLENGKQGDGTENFTYLLQAKEAETPMPQSATGDIYEFSMSGNKETEIGIEYARVGIYTYTLKQSLENKREDWKYDEEEYEIDVYVKNESDQALRTEIIIKNKNQDKPARAVFTNDYEKKEPIKQVKTGDAGEWRIVILAMGISFLAGAVILGKNYSEKSRR